MKLLFVLLVALFGTVHSQGHGALRLVRSGRITTSSSGIVEIYYNSVWGNICNDDTSFGHSEANVVCHQLGYTGVSTYGNTGTVTIYGVDNASTVIEYVVCYSSLLALLQCIVSSRISSYCNINSKDAFVSCYSTRIWNNPYSGQIRLQGGTYSNYGRLEVYCNSQWGTVCGNFDSNDAAVACRQLGYDRAYYTGNLAGSSSQPVWLDKVDCKDSSTTSCLAYCQTCPKASSQSCNHSMDVALGCEFISSTESAVNRPYTTNTTCQNAEADSRLLDNISKIIGGVIGGFILCVVCIIAGVAIPICICCCLGVGVGAATGTRRRSVRTTTTSATNPTVVSTGTAGQLATPPPATTEMSSYQPVPAYFPQTAH